LAGEKKVAFRMSKFGFLALLLGALCMPLTAKADSITAQQVGADLFLVQADIAKNPLAFALSPVAQNDLALGIAAMTFGDIAAAMGHNAEAQVGFQAAINDFNGVLSVLGYAPLGGGDPPAVPEPPTMFLLGLGVTAIGAAHWRKVRAQKLARAEILATT